MTDKAVIITGHAGGIGSTIARALGQANFTRIGIDKTTSAAAVEFEYLVDFEDLAANPALLAAPLDKTLHDRSLCGVINCAALQIVNPVETLAAEDLQRSLAVNVIAPFVIAKLTLARLAETKGTVINIGSIHARLTKAHFLAYSVSKSALAGLTRAMSIELGEQIRVIEIQPAAISTPMLEAGFKGAPGLREKLGKYHPSGDIGSADDIAELCLSLLTNDSPFLNGTTINVDGGIAHVLSDPANEGVA